MKAWRILVVALAAALTMALLAGCGGDDDSGDGAATTAAPSDSGEEDDAPEEESEPLDEDEYADEICGYVEEEALSVDFPPLQDSSFEEIAQLADEQRDEVSSNYEELNALQPPEDLEEVHQQILDAVDELLEVTEAVGDAAKAEDDKDLGDAYAELNGFTTGQEAVDFINEECGGGDTSATTDGESDSGSSDELFVSDAEALQRTLVAEGITCDDPQFNFEGDATGVTSFGNCNGGDLAFDVHGTVETREEIIDEVFDNCGPGDEPIDFVAFEANWLIVSEDAAEIEDIADALTADVVDHC